ncbi:MAG: hypothetical protein ACLP1X_11450 [Polyangiaceae bacterium]|jgi:hypothetical protein
MKAPAAVLFAVVGIGCTVSGGDARYPAREQGCPVKSFPEEPSMPVDELGAVTVDCDVAGDACERKVLDAVCRRGGDVAWGLASNSISATRFLVHAAHTRRVTQGPRDRGCPVQVFTDAPPGRTENIGPVTAICAEDDSREVCLRELEDQVCRLGGDVLWQLEGPAREGNKQRMQGRAAHTK